MVFLYIPNLIGYVRLLLATYAFAFYVETHPIVFLVLYSLSGGLDAVDGHVARLLGQSSRFGAVLDMVTDRVTTSSLLIQLAINAHKFGIYAFALQKIIMLLNALDLISHYAQMYAGLSAGASSHKTALAFAPYLLKVYYQDKRVMFAICAADQLFWLSLYLLQNGYEQSKLACFAMFPLCALKHILNLLQFISASRQLAAIDMHANQKSN